jgi:hypothetical protein
MRQSVFAVVFLWSLLPAHSAAQRGAIRAGGRSSMGFSGSHRLPASDSIVPLRSPRTYNGLRNYGYGWGYPIGFDGYTQPSDYDVNYQNPIVSMPEQDCGPVTIQPPPQPVRPEMHQYTWPDSSGDTAATFVLMLTDGSVRHANAVWIQDNTVHYITRDGAGGRLGLYSVNREGTRLANDAKHLPLRLPPGSQSSPSR